MVLDDETVEAAFEVVTLTVDFEEEFSDSVYVLGHENDVWVGDFAFDGVVWGDDAVCWEGK